MVQSTTEEYLDMVEFTNWGVNFNKQNREKYLNLNPSAQDLIDSVEVEA